MNMNGNIMFASIAHFGGFPGQKPENHRADKTKSFSSRHAINKLKTDAKPSSLNSRLKTPQIHQAAKSSQVSPTAKPIDSHSIKTVIPLSSTRTTASNSALTEQSVSANSDTYQPISAETTSARHELSTAKTTLNAPYTSSIAPSAPQASRNKTEALHQADSASSSMLETSDATRSQSLASSTPGGVQDSVLSGTNSSQPAATTSSGSGHKSVDVDITHSVQSAPGISTAGQSSLSNLPHSAAGLSSSLHESSVASTNYSHQGSSDIPHGIQDSVADTNSLRPSSTGSSSSGHKSVDVDITHSVQSAPGTSTAAQSSVSASLKSLLSFTTGSSSSMHASSVVNSSHPHHLHQPLNRRHRPVTIDQKE